MDIRRLSHGWGRWPLLTIVGSLLCATAALLAGGCQSDEIAVVHVPKSEAKVRLLAAMVLEHDFDRVWFFKLEGPIEQVDKHEEEFDAFLKSLRFTRELDKPILWKLPAGWNEEAGGGLRKKTLRIGDKDDKLAVSVVTLGLMGGDVPMNLNRWRKQVGLPSVPASESEEYVQRVIYDGLPGYRVDLKGPGNPLVKRPPAVDMPAEEERAPVGYTLPENWSKSSRTTQFAAVTLFAGTGPNRAVVTFSPLSPKDDGATFLLENVNRWRVQQLGLSPLKDEADLKPLMKKVQVGKHKDEANSFDMVGERPFSEKDKDGPHRRIVAVVVQRGKTWWFIKLDGPEPGVAEQKANFETFLKSVRID
jgi:hypothetical protein